MFNQGALKPERAALRDSQEPRVVKGTLMGPMIQNRRKSIIKSIVTFSKRQEKSSLGLRLMLASLNVVIKSAAHTHEEIKYIKIAK